MYLVYTKVLEVNSNLDKNLIDFVDRIEEEFKNSRNIKMGKIENGKVEKFEINFMRRRVTADVYLPQMSTATLPTP